MNAAGAAVSIEWKRAVIVSDNLPPPPAQLDFFHGITLESVAHFVFYFIYLRGS